MAQTLGTLLIDVKADTQQLVKGFNRAESAVNKTTKNMTTAVKTFAAAYLSLNAIDLAKTLGNQADAMTNVNSKLKLVTSSTSELVDTQQKLFNISQKTRSSFTNNVDLYQRITFSTKELNLTQEEQLKLTEQINKELLISGTNAAGAATLITQLGQAFSSDFKSVAQELNTLKDQSSSLYQTILAGMNVTSAEFRKMAENGELSSRLFIDAIFNQSKETDKAFSQIATTIDKAYVNVQNSTQKIIGEFDKMTGASQSVSNTLLSISESIESINPEDIQLAAEYIKNAAIAAGVAYTSIKLVSGAYSIYKNELENINRINKLNIDIENAKAQSINLTERAIVARDLATKVSNTTLEGSTKLTKARANAENLLQKSIAATQRVEQLANVSRSDSLLLAKEKEKANRLQIASQKAKEKVDKLSNVRLLGNIELTSTQTRNLNKQAIELEKAAKKAQDYNYQLQNQAKQFKASAFGANLLKSAMSTIPFIAISVGISAIATNLLQAKENSEKLEKTLKLTRKELEKLSESELKSSRNLVNQDLIEKINERQALKFKKQFDEQAKLEYTMLGSQIKALRDRKREIDNALDDLNKKTSSIIESTKKEVKRDETGITSIIGSDKDKFSISIDKQIEKLKKLGATEKEINEFRADEWRKFNEKISKDTKDSLSDTLSTSLSSWANYYETIGNYSTSWLIKEAQLKEEYIDLTEEQFRTLAEKAKTEYFDKIEESRVSNIDTSFIDEAADSQIDLLDNQLSLIDATDSWANSLGGVSGAIGNVMGAFKKLTKVQLKEQKKQIKLDAKLAKTKEKYGEESIEYIEAENDYLMEVSKNKINAQNAEVAGYDNIIGAVSNLSGVIADYGEKSSTAAKAAEAAEKGLAIVQGIRAIIRAWGDPFPLNVVTVPLTIAAVGGLLSQMGASGGGGGGSAPSAQATASMNKEVIDATYNPVTDRLDRQIELLESIDRNGSAGALRVDLAGIEFQRDYAKSVEDILAAMSGTNYKIGALNKVGFDRPISEYRQGTVNLEKELGFDIFNEAFNNIVINKDSLRDSYNLIKLLEEAAQTDTFDFLFLNSNKNWKDLGFDKSELDEYARLMKDNLINDVQATISEFTMNMVDSINDLKDASEDFKSAYDDITGSMYYENKRLSDAFKEVNNITSDLPSYLKNNITAIDELSRFFEEDIFELLLSQDPAKMTAQVQAIEMLQEKTGLVFENGAKDAIDYLESIQLVSEAMATSRENINSFLDSFRTSTQLANIQASSLGVDLAKTAEELFAQFDKFKNDTLGLTDKELEYLESAKDYIQSKNEELAEAQENSIQAQIDGYNELISEVKSNISSVNSVIKTITSTIDKLSDSVTDGEYSLNMFRQRMSEAMSLSGTENYEDFAEAVKSASTYSSALFKEENFNSTRDMLFAQSVARNQFESLEDTSLDQLDYLEMIEENTSNTVDALTAQLKAIESSITGSNDALKDYFDNIYTPEKEEELQQAQSIVNQAFNRALGREASGEGLNWWTNQVQSGASWLNEDLAVNIAQGVSSVGDIGSALNYLLSKSGDQNGIGVIDRLYQDGLIDDSMAKELFDRYAMPNDNLLSFFPSFDYNKYKNAMIASDKVVPFADGGIVTKPTLGLIGEAGYPEAVIPLDGRDSLGIGILTSTIDKQNAIISQQTDLLIENGIYLKETRDLTNDNYVKLSQIKEVI